MRERSSVADSSCSGRSLGEASVVGRVSSRSRAKPPARFGGESAKALVCLLMQVRYGASSRAHK